MYKQTLYKVVEPIRINTIKRLNKSKKWKYGYNKEHDIVVISKTGQIGEIYEIQGFNIALPLSLVLEINVVHFRLFFKRLFILLLFNLYKA